MQSESETLQKDMDRQVKINGELRSQIKTNDRDGVDGKIDEAEEKKEAQETLNNALIIQEHEKRIEDLKLGHAKQCEELCSEIISANQEVARLNILLENTQQQPHYKQREIANERQTTSPIDDLLRRGGANDDGNYMQSVSDPNEVELKQQQWQQEQLLQQEQLQQTTKRYLDSNQKQQRKTRTLSFRKSLAKNQSEQQQQQRSRSWKVGDDISNGGLVGNAGNNSTDNEYYYYDDDSTSNGGIVGHYAATEGGSYGPLVESSTSAASASRLFSTSRRLLSLKKLSRKQRRRRLIVLVVTGVVLAYWVRIIWLILKCFVCCRSLFVFSCVFLVVMDVTSWDTHGVYHLFPRQFRKVSHRFFETTCPSSLSRQNHRTL